MSWDHGFDLTKGNGQRWLEKISREVRKSPLLKDAENVPVELVIAGLLHCTRSATERHEVDHLQTLTLEILIREESDL